jgi:hypothetical protein
MNIEAMATGVEGTLTGNFFHLSHQLSSCQFVLNQLSVKTRVVKSE